MRPLGEKASAVGEGVAGGALHGRGVIPGVLTGATLGAPAGPVGAVVGGLVGGGIGMWAGDTAAEGLRLRQPSRCAKRCANAGCWVSPSGGSMGALRFPYFAAATGSGSGSRRPGSC